MKVNDPHYLKTAHGMLAIRGTIGVSDKPAVLWLGGFMSDMTGSKASALLDWAEQNARNYRSFDYFAHGASEGDMRHFTISRGIENALAVFDDWKQDKVILVGSSMGAWVALRLAQILGARGGIDKIAAMVLIAPAPDFTERLMWDAYSDDIKNKIMEKGEYLQPSQYSEDAYLITRDLIEDGRKHLLLGKPYECSFPVRILQGLNDPDVPWQHALELTHALQGQVSLSLIKDGDHRLSTPDNIKQMIAAVEAIA